MSNPLNINTNYPFNSNIKNIDDFITKFSPEEKMPPQFSDAWKSLIEECLNNGQLSQDAFKSLIALCEGDKTKVEEFEKKMLAATKELLNR